MNETKGLVAQVTLRGRAVAGSQAEPPGRPCKSIVLVAKLIAIAVIGLALTVPTQAHFNCVTNNGTIAITGYTGTSGDVTIPDTIYGLPVTCIGDYAFDRSTNQTSVMIPNSVISIKERAFAICSTMTSVTIGNSATNIGQSAFYQDISLTSVTIPDNLTSILRMALGAPTRWEFISTETPPPSVLPR